VSGSTVKKVIVRRFDRETLTGFINPFSYLQPQSLELLTPNGALLTLSYNEVKSVCFVKDFEADVESRKVFLNRPKLAGLWVRMVFRDGEVLDGILPNDLLAWEIAGFTVTPPEPDANNQKVFVPREALRSIEVLGVVGGPLGKKRKKPADANQPTLF
jgi:hypothetical protein